MRETEDFLQWCVLLPSENSTPLSCSLSVSFPPLSFSLSPLPSLSLSTGFQQVAESLYGCGENGAQPPGAVSSSLIQPLTGA